MRLYGESHATTLIKKREMATLYYDQGLYKEALPLAETALKGHVAALGIEHPESMQVLFYPIK